MFRNKRILAVVPARSGSKAVKNKNMRKIGDFSLIAHAGLCLQKLPWIDWKIISTDSSMYGEEGRRFGLEVPFIRPEELSQDQNNMYFHLLQRQFS